MAAEDQEPIMTDKYTPQVGDRVRPRAWADGDYIDVEAVTDQHVYGVDKQDMPEGYYLDDDWVKIDKPRQIPERWLTVDHDDDVIVLYRASDSAIRRDYPHDTYRIWTDPDGTPRIERTGSL